MDLHSEKIKVHRSPSQGSTFTRCFLCPIRQGEGTSLNYRTSVLLLTNPE